MKTRMVLMVLLALLLGWSEGHCGFWLVSETNPPFSDKDTLEGIQPR